MNMTSTLWEEMIKKNQIKVHSDRIYNFVVRNRFHIWWGSIWDGEEGPFAVDVILKIRWLLFVLLNKLFTFNKRFVTRLNSC